MSLSDADSHWAKNVHCANCGASVKAIENVQVVKDTMSMAAGGDADIVFRHMVLLCLGEAVSDR